MGRKHNAEIVLRALLNGIPVKLDEATYELVEGDLCIPLTCIKQDGAEEERLAVVDMPLGAFIREAEKLSQDDIACLAASLALKKERSVTMDRSQ